MDEAPEDDFPPMTPQPGVSRRQFLGRTAQNAAGLAAGFVGLAAAAGAASGSEPVRLGVIGVRRQGKKLATEFAKLPGAAVVALSDIDESVLDRAAKEVSELGPTPRSERDFRRLLDDSQIDAVAIATPDHSHVAIAIEALRAGKDVYVETPVSHTIAEGEALLAAAREGGRVVQCGLFDRSLPHVRSAVEFVQTGRLGTVPLVKAWAVHRRATPGAIGPVEAPSGVDYDSWLYPAPERPFDPLRFHRGWSDFWDYGSGELGAWGVALLDLARLGLGVGMPERVAATGGRLGDGPGETPDTLHVTYGYPQATVLWEHRRWSNHPPEGRSAGVAFYGERGTLVLDRGGWKVYDAAEPAGENGRADLAPHLQDFLGAMRTRCRPAAPVEDGIAAATLCHLGNLAYRLGREVRLEPETGRLPVGPDVAALSTVRYRPGVRYA
jgi:predicted dehydrogenase